MMIGEEIFPVLGELNGAFGGANPSVGPEFAAHFAPGKALGPALESAMAHRGQQRLSQLLTLFVGAMPGALQESLRATLHYALSQSPPARINFAWAPSYDFELNIWEAVEPKPHPAGITVLLKSRYPDHKERFGA